MSTSNSDSFGNLTGGEPTPTPMVNPLVTVSSDYINYAGPPTLKPPQIQYIVVDSNMRQWQFNATTGAWQIILILCLLALSLFSVSAQNVYFGTFNGNGSLTNFTVTKISFPAGGAIQSLSGAVDLSGGGGGLVTFSATAGDHAGVLYGGQYFDIYGQIPASTNIMTLSGGFTNTSSVVVNGAFSAMPNTGLLTVSMIVTNTQVVWLTNATSGLFIPLGNLVSTWTNYDTVAMGVNAGDSVAVTNISGSGGSTLVGSFLQTLR
jgi:hypothetical protein